jgi:hypothetical protein
MNLFAAGTAKSAGMKIEFIQAVFLYWLAAFTQGVCASPY